MANIDIQQPAKINRNTAADGDFLWEKDFKVLYDNDEKLKNAIQQASQDYTAGDGIDIDPSTKTISVKTGTGIKKTEEGLSVNIEGVAGAKVELEGNTFKVSAYNAEPVIDALNDNLAELQQDLIEHEEFAKEFYITSAAVSTPNTQYVYTTSGWQALAGGEVQELAYWRPYFDSADNKIKWEQQPSSVLTPPLPSNSLKGPQGDPGDNGKDGNDGVSPTVALSPIDDGTKTGTEIVIKDKDGDHTYSAWNGINGTNGANGTNGKSVELSAATDNAHLNWRLVGDTTWQDLGYAVSGLVGPRGPQGEQGPRGEQGPKGDAPTIQATILQPTSEHTEGGVRWTIKYPEQTVSAIGDIWNGNNGTAIVNCDGRWITGNGTAGNVIRLTTETLDALQSVSGKVSPAEQSSDDDYFVWKYSNQSSAPSGWTPLKIAGANEGWLNSSDLDLYLKPENGLSGKWVGGNTQKYQFGLSAEYEDNIKAVPNKIDKTQLQIDDTINEIKYTDGNNSSAISAVNYKEGHTGWNAQQLFVVNGDTELINLVNGGACGNKGSIFFVVSGHQ